MQEILLSNINFTEIKKEFISKLKKEKLDINSNNIYADLELLKKDKTNSFIYHIVEKYLIKNNYQHDVKNIMYVASNFFDIKYKKILIEYKKAIKKEFDINNKEINEHVILKFKNKKIKVPKRIGHNYIPIKILPLKHLKTKYSRHRRLKTFHIKGLNCVSCPKKGKYLIATKDRNGSIHIDLYTNDFELMTVDHIKPKSLGGTYDIENLDPMCQTCNSEKSDKWEE
jgi:hypothetical protein